MLPGGAFKPLVFYVKTGLSEYALDIVGGCVGARRTDWSWADVHTKTVKMLGELGFQIR